MLIAVVLAATLLCSFIGDGVCERPVLLKSENEAEGDSPWRVNLMQPYVSVAAGRHKRSGSYSSSRNLEMPSRLRFLDAHREMQAPDQKGAIGQVQTQLQEKHLEDKSDGNNHKYSSYHPYLGEWRFRVERNPREASPYLSQRWPSAASAEEEPLEAGGENDVRADDSQGWSGVLNDSGDKQSAETVDLAVAKETKNIDADPQNSNSISKDTSDGQRSESEELSLTKNEDVGEESNVLSRVSKDTNSDQNPMSQDLPLQKNDGFIEDSPLWSSESKDNSGERPELEEYAVTQLYEGDSEGSRVWRSVSKEASDGQSSGSDYLPLAKSDDISGDSNILSSISKDTSDEQRPDSEDLALAKGEVDGENSQVLSSISKDANDVQRPESEEVALMKNYDDSQVLRSVSNETSDEVHQEPSFIKRDGIDEYSQMTNSFSKGTNDEQGSQSEDLTFAKVDASAAEQESGGEANAVAGSDTSVQGQEGDSGADTQQGFYRSSRSVKAATAPQPAAFLNTRRGRRRHGSDKRNLKKKRLISRNRRGKLINMKPKNKYKADDKKNNKQTS